MRWLKEWYWREVKRRIVPDECCLPLQEKEQFLSELDKANVYLEYGAGGSTLEAVRRVKTVISVDNDRVFLRCVGVKARNQALGRFCAVYANIGTVMDWGIPKHQQRTPSRLRRWRAYSAAPWQLIERLGLVPDFILIDGRFRVSCTLECLLRVPSQTHFLFDDFNQRREMYGAIIEFVADVKSHGRPFPSVAPIH